MNQRQSVNKTIPFSPIVLSRSGNLRILLLLAMILIFQSENCKKSEEIFYCPMHPDYTATRPGDCPICGMKLVQKKEELLEDSKHSSAERPTLSNHPHKRDLHPNEKDPEIHFHTNNSRPQNPPKEMRGIRDFRISTEKQKSIGVKTTKVEYGSLELTILSSGQVLYDPELYVAIVEYKEVVRLGSFEDPGLIHAAKMKLRKRGLLDPDIRFWAKMDPEVFLTGRSGTKAYVFSQIFEKDLKNLKTGKKVELHSGSSPEVVYQGQILGWFKVLDEKNRSTKVWIEVQDPNRKLTPGMFIEVKIPVSIANTLYVPRTAVMHTGLQNIVYVQTSVDRFLPVHVVIGQENRDFIQILSGLQEGEIVVVGANFLVDSEARLQLGRDL